MEALLTVADVAVLLKIHPKTVYEHAAEWGGFYPAPLRVLRFRPEVIRGIMEGGQKVEVRFPAQREILRGRRIQDQKGGPSVQGVSATISSQFHVDPRKYGIVPGYKPIPARKRREVSKKDP